MVTVLDGKMLSESIIGELAQHVRSKKIAPRLAAVLVGDNDASAMYVEMKGRACEKIGGSVQLERLSEKSSTQQVVDLIEKLNGDNRINGILVQLPLPKQVDAGVVLQKIALEKDVDGLHPIHLAAIFEKKTGFVPATAKGILKLLDHYNISLEGKNCVVIGRSVEVGIPVAGLLLARNATVTIAHSKTQNLSELCKSADVIVSAVGKAGIVSKDMVKPGAAVVDVGTNFVVEDGKRRVVGDVEAGVADVAGFLSPVPGGVGPMTVACLLENLVQASRI